jgi:alpha-beta hydrolase superfamily lysophospholipase
VILLVGRGEHPGVYERFGTRIGADGYRVRVVGDGTVDPAAVEEDVRRLLADEDLPVPRVLAGSDSGALLALRLAQTLPVDALLLAGLPTSTGGAEGDVLSERTACPAHRGRLEADPLVAEEALRRPLPDDFPTVAELAGVRVPVLALHGEADLISPVDAARAAYAAAPSVELVTIDEGKHDALNDATHRTAAAETVLFLERLRRGPALLPIAHHS